MGEDQMMHLVKVVEVVQSFPDRAVIAFEGENVRFRKWVPLSDVAKFPIGKEFTISLVEGGLPF